jgi:hypothetical protein
MQKYAQLPEQQSMSTLRIEKKVIVVLSVEHFIM